MTVSRSPGLADDQRRVLRSQGNADARGGNPLTLPRGFRKLLFGRPADAAGLRGTDELFFMRNPRLFERATSAAKIGLWACDLADETLHWTAGTYDLFGLRRGARLDRGDTLRAYTEQSRATLTAVRGDAIGRRTGFDLDAEIVLASGARRWIRITAALECDGGRPVRLYGVKRDVTEERMQLERARQMAEIDPLTGLANRAGLQARLAALCERSATAALLLVDLDSFKQVNDSIGHAGGDDCLGKAAFRLASACRNADLVARIGGDEFAVILEAGGIHQAECLAAGIVTTMARPFACAGRSFRLGASVGLAFIEGETPAQVYERADFALYAAKAAAGNTWRRLANPPAEACRRGAAS